MSHPDDIVCPPPPTVREVNLSPQELKARLDALARRRRPGLLRRLLVRLRPRRR